MKEQQFGDAFAITNIFGKKTIFGTIFCPKILSISSVLHNYHCQDSYLEIGMLLTWFGRVFTSFYCGCNAVYYDKVPHFSSGLKLPPLSTESQAWESSLDNSIFLLFFSFFYSRTYLKALIRSCGLVGSM